MSLVTIRFRRANPSSRHFTNWRSLSKWLRERGVPFQDGGSGDHSYYLYVDVPDGDVVTIRLSGHPQKRDEMGQVRGGRYWTEYGPGEHATADYSVAPGEGTLAGAKRYLTELYGGQWPVLHDEQVRAKVMEHLRFTAKEARGRAETMAVCAAESEQRAARLQDSDPEGAMWVRRYAADYRRPASEWTREAEAAESRLRRLEHG